MKTAEFFERLPREDKARLIGPVRGTVRSELTDATGTEYWLLTIGPNGIHVALENRAADCVIRMDKELFEKIANGEANIMAATLRGEVAVEGEPDLVVAVQRLFPGPPGQVS